MINKRENIFKIAIDSPAAAGAGTLAKAISKHYNLLTSEQKAHVNKIVYEQY